MGDTKEPPKCLAGVRRKMSPPQQHIEHMARSQLDCGLAVLHVLPHGLRDMCMIRLGLLALNGHGCEVVDILTSVCNIGWCIVGRQAIWWEGMLVMNLHKTGSAHTS